MISIQWENHYNALTMLLLSNDCVITMWFLQNFNTITLPWVYNDCKFTFNGIHLIKHYYTFTMLLPLPPCPWQAKVQPKCIRCVMDTVCHRNRTALFDTEPTSLDADQNLPKTTSDSDTRGLGARSNISNLLEWRHFFFKISEERMHNLACK